MEGARVNEIDLLRFLAVLGVVFFHYGFRGYQTGSMPVQPYQAGASIFQYGYLGVNLFFMISGFVILMTAARGSLREFVISRMARLYPALWACCTITFLMIMAVGDPRYSASFSHYLVNLTMLNGFVGVESIDGVYWSLFVELRFYALVALVLFLGKIHKAEVFLLFWLVCSILLECFPVSKLRYLFITEYSPFFIAGAACYLILAQGISLRRVSIIIISWVLALFKSVTEIPRLEHEFKSTMNPYAVAMAVTAFFAIMMLIALRKTGWFSRPRWMLAGVLTYPLYLLHQKIGFMVFRLGYSKVNMHLLFWGVFVASLIAAGLVHALIERPSSPVLKSRMHKLADHLQGLLVFLNEENRKAR